MFTREKPELFFFRFSAKSNFFFYKFFFLFCSRSQREAFVTIYEFAEKFDRIKSWLSKSWRTCNIELTSLRFSSVKYRKPLNIHFSLHLLCHISSLKKNILIESFILKNSHWTKNSSNEIFHAHTTDAFWNSTLLHSQETEKDRERLSEGCHWAKKTARFPQPTQFTH